MTAGRRRRRARGRGADAGRRRLGRPRRAAAHPRPAPRSSRAGRGGGRLPLRLSAPALPFSFSRLARKLEVDEDGRSRGPGGWPPRRGDLLSWRGRRGDARRASDAQGPGSPESSAAAGPRRPGDRDGLAPTASGRPRGARSGRACRLGAGPRAVSRRGGKGRPRWPARPGVAGGRARERGGRCAQSVQPPARL